MENLLINEHQYFRNKHTFILYLIMFLCCGLSVCVCVLSCIENVIIVIYHNNHPELHVAQLYLNYYMIIVSEGLYFDEVET